MCLFTIALIGALLFFLVRKGRIGPPPWVGKGGANPFSPEADARRTLANRFATGDISSEEFLERASALNWTPGVDPKPGNGNGGKRS
jgi:putative membrane protein